MLWYKGWLETRLKLLVALGIMGFIFTSAHMRGIRMPVEIKAFVINAMFLGVVIPTMFAGAGIKTQPAFQGTKGLHGSMYFTLSLPVSRFRLLASRASLGWLQMVGMIGAWCCALWLLFPALKEVATAAELFEHEVAFVACASTFYAINVFLATFLDEQWRLYGSGIAIGALWLLFKKTLLPASVNIFRAMGEGSPLITHAMPWTAMGFSLCLAAILFFAALKVVQLREY
jgi:hypothetical protein